MILLVVLCLLALATLTVLGVVSLTISKNLSGVVSATQNLTITDETAITANPTVPAGQDGTLSTRTDANTGVVTMAASGHGIITGQRVDVYWEGGSRYGMTVGTVSGVTVPIDLGGGDNLPVATTAVIIGIATAAPFNVRAYDKMSALAMSTPVTGYFVFNDGTDNQYAAKVTGGTIFDWNADDVGSNPLGDVTTTTTTVYISHEDTTAANQQMQAVALTHN